MAYSYKSNGKKQNFYGFLKKSPLGPVAVGQEFVKRVLTLLACKIFRRCDLRLRESEGFRDFLVFSASIIQNHWRIIEDDLVHVPLSHQHAIYFLT